MNLTNKEREVIIENAMREYKSISESSVFKKSKPQILNAINNLNNVYIMCCNYSLKGLSKLEQLIKIAETNCKE